MEPAGFLVRQMNAEEKITAVFRSEGARDVCPVFGQVGRGERTGRIRSGQAYNSVSAFQRDWWKKNIVEGERENRPRPLRLSQVGRGCRYPDGGAERRPGNSVDYRAELLGYLFFRKSQSDPKWCQTHTRFSVGSMFWRPYPCSVQ